MEKWVVFLLAWTAVLVFTSQILAKGTGDMVKVNQVGYVPLAPKIVIVIDEGSYDMFQVIDTETDLVVYTGTLGRPVRDRNSGQTVRHGEFSTLQDSGQYVVEVPGLGHSYPFIIGENVYRQTLTNTVRSYSLQRSNTSIDDPITGLKIAYGHKQDAQARMFFSDDSHKKGDLLDVSGGWYDAGDYGKYIPPAAVAVAQMLLAYELRSDVFEVGQLDFPFDIPEEDRVLPDLLAELKFELEWMERMQRQDGAVYHKVAGIHWPGFIRPEADTQTRYVLGMSTYGTAQYAAVMAMAARVYRDFIPEFADRMLRNAELAYEYLANNPKPEFRTDEGQNTGSGGYDKTTDAEERFWALAELFKTTGDERYHEQLMSNHKRLISRSPEFVTWYNAQALGQWAYYTAVGAAEEEKTVIRRQFVRFADAQLRNIERDGYNNILDAREYTWASAKNAVAKGNLLIMANYMEPKQEYINGAIDQLHNVLGRSATGYSYVTGAGTRFPRNHHHRILQSTKAYVPGFLVGGPNRYGGDPDLDRYLKEQKPAPAMAYLDISGSWSSNEFAVDYTAPLVFMLAHFADSSLFDQDLDAHNDEPGLKPEMGSAVEVQDSVEAEFGRRVYEAEEAQLIGVRANRSMKGFSGGGYVSGFTNDTGSVNFSVEIPLEGLYQLYIGYGTPHGQKNTNLVVNGTDFGEVTLPVIRGFGEMSAGPVLLKQGTNTITLEKGWGWYDIDYIALEAVSKPETPELHIRLVNKNATDETRALMSFLVENYGKYVLSGQQEYPGSRYADVKYIYEHTGKKPAVLGLDLMEYSPSRVAHGASSNEIETAIEWHNQGGIVTLTWHWNAPAGLGKNKQPWWRGFYTEATSFDLAAALKQPESEEYALLLRDMDVIAGELKQLQEAKVPVLWRPLHEAEGGWFWWGAKGPEPAKELWRLVYERLTHHHGLNNLIWVWNSVSEAWYPGDDCVDIVSYDSYPRRYDYNPVAGRFEALSKLGKVPKIAALGENGSIPDPDLMQRYGATWSWFVTWNGEILREHNDLEHLAKVYNHPFVLTLDELPDIYGQ